MEYKVDDYVVCLSKNDECSAGFKANFCLRIMNTNETSSGICLFFHQHSHGIYLNSVRKANQQEINHYNKIGKPYDVTTIDFDLTINNFEIW